MRVAIVYESIFGNTRAVAESVARGVRDAAPEAEVTCTANGIQGVSFLADGGSEQRMEHTNTPLKQLIADLFKCSVADLTDATGPGDIPGWDSLGHVMLMAAIQRQFGQHVPVEDAIEVTSIADLEDILNRLQKATAWRTPAGRSSSPAGRPASDWGSRNGCRRAAPPSGS